jgi:hypothetical protein
MNTTKLFAAAAFVALASMGAQAGEADYAQNVPSFHSERTVAAVKAEAVQQANKMKVETAGSRVAVLVNSGIDRAAVRQQTAIALRAGQIHHGEASMM